MSRRFMSPFLAPVAALLVLAALPSRASGASETVAHLDVGSTVLDWSPLVDAAGIDLRVSGPDGFYFQQYFEAPAAPSFSIFDVQGAALADGIYKYELRVRPRLTDAERAQLMAERGTGKQLRVQVQSGTFSVAGGAIVPRDRREVSPGPGSGGEQLAGEPPGGSSPSLSGGGDRAVTPLTVLSNGNGVIRNSLCVGFDCPNSPSFSDTTILLMENNTRIKFDDTSTLSGFPSRDWELQANSNSSGGGSYFAINDCAGSSQGGCAADPLFKIEANAPANSLYVDDGGRVGLGTSTPSVELHVIAGDSPTLRLQQDGSSGFAPQTWDVAGNETSFFVRDTTNGSTLPFRIRPGAASNSLVIDTDDDVGIGTLSSDASLHVKRSDGTAQILVEETGSPASQRGLLFLRNNGGVSFVLRNDDISESWSIGQSSHDFVLNQQQNGGIELRLTPDGELTIEGTLNTGSSRAIKENIAPINTTEALAKILELPVASWTYTNQEAAHVGPMAEDFRSLFGLGESDRYLAPSDLAGLAVAAIQGLHRELRERDDEIEQLKARISTLEDLLAVPASP